MQQKWDNRYREEAYAYGKAPNVFFSEWLTRFTPGSILMPADGEGRNGVFAAELGWQVTSFDLSIEGQSKAKQLAQEKNVTLQYIVSDLTHLTFDPGSFDAIGMIYAHFDADRKAAFHRKLDNCLKSGGIVLFEAFSKNHLVWNQLHPEVGGPREAGMLYSIAEIRAYFPGYEILLLQEEEIQLQEGKYHNGTGSVIRFAGRKQ